MEGNVKVSIIMPVYKVEEYVGKAIESIQAQTLTDWEFLIVDDGTPVSYTHLLAQPLLKTAYGKYLMEVAEGL